MSIIQEVQYDVARPLALPELEAWRCLADGHERGTIPLLAIGACVRLRLSDSRRGRAAQPYAGKIAVAVAATVRAVESLASAACESARETVESLPEVALDAYEDLLGYAMPVAQEVALAERMRRSGCLVGRWWLERDWTKADRASVGATFRYPDGNPS